MTKMKNRKLIYIASTLIVLFGIVVWGYLKYASRTVVATLNFPDFTVEKLIRSNNNPFVKIVSIDLDKAETIAEYDMVLVRVHGSSMNKNHLESIKHAIAKGVPVYSTEKTNKEINSLSGRALDYIATLMDNGSVKNYRSLFNYIRKEVDKKIVFNAAYEEPVFIPEDYFFHLGEDRFFDSFEAYQQFYEQSGRYKKGAPRIVLLSGNINMQNSNDEHITALIQSLERKGLNVYPIYSFGMKKLEMIAAVQPNLIINRPHGRLLMGNANLGIQLLERLNVPVLAPVTVSEPYEKWLTGKQGMASGGMTSMSVVLPELDGMITPFAISAQFERNGRQLFEAIPEHTEKFCRLVKNFTDLQIKSNSEKKIAIYYYKGTGKGSVSAADIEGVQSLYNTLTLLQKNGYNVTGLPASAKELENLIQRSGSVLGSYALGAYDEFLKDGNPALVNIDTFRLWSTKQLPEKLIQDMKEQYGEAPGKYMNVEKADKKYIAVARIAFGNVVILPQPMPGVGDDIDKLIHGTEGAPAYPYVASYLWTRNQFGANAVIHFGTHGSLEFIPGKQVALSNYDWSDVLIADMPHFYIYTINNIGEGIIAKRRSYATLVSHLTSPFMQGEVYGDLQKLKQTLSKYETLDAGDIKRGYAETIALLAKKQNILSALSIDSTQILSDESIKRIHLYVEEIDGAKVIDGLYTLGEPYSADCVANTTRLISIDALRYSLAARDVALSKVEASVLDNPVLIAKNYTTISENLIRKAMAGEDTDKLFIETVGEKQAQLLTNMLTHEKQEKTKQIQRMQKAMSAKKESAKPKFLDEHGKLIQKKEETDIDTREEQPSMMAKMTQVQPAAMHKNEQFEQTLLTALQSVKEAINNIPVVQRNLSESTIEEQKALLNALNGKYVKPGSAGDPIVNPKAIPTGKNFYSINPETTPSEEAWKVGKRLADNLLEAELKAKGQYPEKVSFSLWATDFISSEGATVAQILYLLGVEPLRDGFGYIRSLQLIPEEELKRPRIDVVVQTSGQLRDIAASRLQLIQQAVRMAAEDNCRENFVRKGFADAERRLLEKGFSPADARKYSGERVFGGANGNYGTGIMSKVEKGDKWDNTSELASQYIHNMSAMYSANGDDAWGEMKEGVFEAALLNTSVVVQPRSSNTWGPLSLDHVYEFMGGISAAIKQVTGNDPTGYFNDFRNTNRAKIQELKEAIGVETNSTLFNPKYISEMLKGEASAMDHFAESFRNTYGWNALKPSAIDQHIWNKYYDIYVKDELNLDIHATFDTKNPYALQEMTAVMLESARKGMWQASEEQLKEISKLHAKLINEHEAGCSGFICDNGKLRDFISKLLPTEKAKDYNESIKAAREVQLTSSDKNKNVVLQKEEQQIKQSKKAANSNEKRSADRTWIYLSGGFLLILAAWLIIKKQRKH